MIGRPANDGAAEETDEQRDHPPRSGGETGRNAHPSRSRRGVLRGMAGMGIGIGTTTPGRMVESVENLLSQVDEEDLPASSGGPDPHTVATFEAIVDAVVPNTRDDPVREKLPGEDGERADLGRVYQYGGLQTDLPVQGIRFINDFISPEAAVPRLANSGETATLSEAVAAVLDTAASELITRGGNEDTPEPGRFGPAGGPFAGLSRADRFRALRDVEKEGGKNGGFVVALAVAFPALAHYSDLDGYDDFLDEPPSERTFLPKAHNSFETEDDFELDGDVPPGEPGTLLGWAQTGYPGIDPGYDVLLGYELDGSFEPTGKGRSRDSSVVGTEPFWRDDGSTAGDGPGREPTPRDGSRDDGGWFPLDPETWFDGGGVR